MKNKLKKLALISLGCEKNLVDSEMILGLVRKGQVEIIDNPNNADVIIINTCGFIESAKTEAIDTIIETKQSVYPVKSDRSPTKDWRNTPYAAKTNSARIAWCGRIGRHGTFASLAAGTCSFR